MYHTTLPSSPPDALRMGGKTKRLRNFEIWKHGRLMTSTRRSQASASALSLGNSNHIVRNDVMVQEILETSEIALLGTRHSNHLL
jgi:hypothetical protein